MGKIVQEGQSMFGCSSGTISKMFSADHIVIVHIMYFNFIVSVHCSILFSLGPEVKAIILKKDFSFSFSLFSRFGSVIAVLKVESV